MKNIIFIMGVSGCGKSTIGKLLSQHLTIPFFDGDDFHPQSNVNKMSKGLALDDKDRQGWLTSLNNLAKNQIANNSCIIACSALKQKYRDILSRGIEGQTKWVHLTGSFEQIFERVNARPDHFMPSELLKSQFNILENPESALQIDVGMSPENIVKIIENKMTDKTEFGILGLGVMGKSLARNLADKGCSLSMFNRHVALHEEEIAEKFKDEFKELNEALAFDDLAAFTASLELPRKIMLMVNAGKTVDMVIEDLLPHLSDGDIIIDGGNSNYLKTKERFEYLKTKSIHFIGAGVSGGEEGALKGPSIMLGGDKTAYDEVQPFLESIAAKDKNGLPCCTYIGAEGSGHFVKMVHNGIEYVEMQLLAEVFAILLKMDMHIDEIADTLESWRKVADSYLLEITIDILRKTDGEDRLIHKILDKAGNKGTGNWTTITTAELGVPSTLIASALFARYISAYKDERIRNSKLLRKEDNTHPALTVEEVLSAYKFARSINHYQGFNLIKQASYSFSWKLNLSEIARIWTSGCIIKSTLMQELVELLKDNENLFESPMYFKKIENQLPSATKVIAESILNRIPIPCLSESINFFNGMTTTDSTASLIQAQRDYFGAHTYQRNDTESNDYFHTDWKAST